MWLFDENEPRLATFQEYLLQLADGLEYRAVVDLQLLEVQDQPRSAGVPVLVDDDLVYLRITGTFPPPYHVVPWLLLGYQLDVKARLIHPLFVCKAAAVEIPGVRTSKGEAGITAEPVENVIRRALQHAKRHRWH